MENELDNFGKGGIREDIPDPRDYQWGKDVGSATIPFDWSLGYDIEEVLGTKLNVPNFKLKVKNQNGSSSCGGQAWAYYGEVLDGLSDETAIEEKSAKFIYAQTHVGTGGSGGRENCTVCINGGWGNEADTPSYENNLPPSEAFMILDDISAIAKQNALKDKGLAYANVLTRNPEDIATAVRDNYGCILGVTGSNNGTWRTEFPLPPDVFANSWNHWLYLGKLKMINGKRYFGILNSWGTDQVGDAGWQWLSEDYITKMILGYPVIFSVWTMVMKADVVVPPPYQFTKTLKFGMHNGDVKMLQMKLGGLMTDGWFGFNTLKAVKKFQVANGLVADGVVGPKTNVILNSL